MRTRRGGSERGLGTLRSLRIRNYRLYCLGQLASLCGSWMQSVALVWLVLERTDSGTHVGMITAAQFLPILLLAGPAGVLVDRLDRRRAVLIAAVALLLQAVVLAALAITDTAELWMLYGLALWQGAGTSLDQPARQSLLSELVSEDDLPNAVSLNAAMFTMARVAGPAVAAVIISVSGVVLCFVLNALSFVAIIAAVTAMRADELRPRGRLVRAKGQLREGVSAVVRNPSQRSLLLSGAALGLFAQHGQVVLPLLARETFDGGAGMFGTMAAVNAAGACGAAFWLAGAKPPSDRRIMLLAALFGLSALATVATPILLLALLLLPIVGFAHLGVLVTTNTANQLRSPPELRGRAIALYFAVTSGSGALGSLLMGLLVDAVGPRITMVIGAAVCFIVAATWRLSASETAPAGTPMATHEVVAPPPGLDV